MAISTSYYDRVRYTLRHKGKGSLTVTEPIGWNEDEKEFARNTDYDGIVTKQSNALVFVLEGADWLENVLSIYGINAEVRLEKDVRNEFNDVWERSYSGYLDLSTYEREKNNVSIKFSSGGIEQLFKSRQSEKIEIDRQTDLDGKPLTPLVTKRILMEGREIFLKSAMDIAQFNNKLNMEIKSNSGGTLTRTGGIPLNAAVNSHQTILKSVAPQTFGNESNGDLDMMFIFDCDRDRVFDIDINGKLDAFVQQYENIQYAVYKIALTKYENSFDFDFKERIILTDLNDITDFDIDFDGRITPYTVKDVPFAYSNDSFDVLQGESVALEVYMKADFYTDINAGLRVFAQNITVDLKLDENSQFEQTEAETVLAHEVGDRITEIITGRKKAFYSEPLGRTELGYNTDGKNAFIGFSHGLWLRGFSKLPLSEDNKYKPLTTSWKDWIESLNVTEGLSMGIETIGYSERVIVADKKYFYNNNVGLRLPNQVQNVKRSIATDYYYSGLEIGYDKTGDYEEAMGLDEYNTLSTFSTVITAVKNIFKKVTGYRTDSYGAEFARRKPKKSFPTQDTPYDKDVFMFDLKKFTGNLFKVRKWQDDFAKQPTGVFSPNTAFNLRWSPVNLILRHGWEVAASFIAYPNDYLRYGSSTANSKLKTQLIGENEFSENEDILNSALEKPRFIPEFVEFEHQVSTDILKQLEGVKEILGVKIPTMYCLIEFTNERGAIEKGYLMNLKPNKEGKWRLLKANR